MTAPHWRTADGTATLCDRLAAQAAAAPDKIAFSMLSDRGRKRDDLATGELWQRVQCAAGALLALTNRQDPVACVLDTGLNFVVAFLACLWSGRIAVPIAPPRPNGDADGLAAIMRHSGVRVVFSTANWIAKLRGETPSALVWLDVEAAVEADALANSLATPSDLALLQYTSGSTGTPKGVMIGHDNLAANALQIAASFEHNCTSSALTWLPLQHDMGLIGGIVHPLYIGFPSYLMSAVEMIRDPGTWLRAMSKYRISTSGGPNFGFELCLKRIAPEKRAELDLSGWTVAFCGAEPISQTTLDRFASGFAVAGFREEALLPCYGMAEATLEVSSIPKTSRPTARAPLGGPPGRKYVDCGAPVPGQNLLIWDETGQSEVKPGHKGEIWLQGPNVAKGYWRDPVRTAAVFGAHAPGRPGRWLRTGDIAFVRDGRLHICGRERTEVIVRGVKHSLEDIEATAATAHPMLEGNRAVAYAENDADVETLVIVQELPRTFRDPEVRERIGTSIRQSVVRSHGISPLVAFADPGAIPRTRSGKLQRHLCSAIFRDAVTYT